MTTSKYFIPYGYYDSPKQTEPEFDPGLDVDCPVCGKQLSRPVITESLIIGHTEYETSDGQMFEIDDSRSYFYRMHKACYDNLSPEEVGVIEDRMVGQRLVELGKLTLEEYEVGFGGI